MESFDLIVLGAGPGGYVGAIRAAQLGMRVALIEKEALGGVCLNWGCMPTKALLQTAEMFSFIQKDAAAFGIHAPNAAIDYPKAIGRSRDVVAQLVKGISFLLEKNKVSVCRGAGRLTGSHTLRVDQNDANAPLELQFQKLLIATGAAHRAPPAVTIDGARIMNAKHALGSTHLPASVVIIGAGAIGAEFAYFYARMGAKVTLLEAFPRILPLEDEEVSQALARAFRKIRIDIKTNAKVLSCETRDNEVSIQLDDDSALSAEKVLVATGVQPCVSHIGIEHAGIEIRNGAISVNDFFQTSAPHIYAAGDVIGPPYLAHVASHEAVSAVEHMAGGRPHPINYNAIPACTYTQPQVASIGLTEQRAKENGIETRVGRFPFKASGKALAAGHTDGFVKLIFDASSHELIGAHLVGHAVSEMIGGLSVMMGTRVTAADVANAIFPHPTCAEAIYEAALDADKRAIHIFV